MQKQAKSEYIQFLSFVSCLAVVFLHVNGCFWKFSYERYWITANFIECIMFFAVPEFFMISGATLMGYRERYSTQAFFKKRIKKTLVPFVCWSVLAVLWRIFWTGQDIHFNREMLDGMFNTSYITIYYFFPALFSLYLSIPVLSAVPREQRKNIFGYAIIAGLVVNVILPFICLLTDISYNEYIRIPVVSGYLIYIFAGYWIDNYEISKKFRYIIYVSGIAGLAVHIIGTQVLSFKYGEIVGTFKGYTNLPCFLYSIAIFTFFKNLKKGRLYSCLAMISKPFIPLTFGIYLVHWYIMEFAVSFFNLDVRDIVYRTAGALVIFITAALVTFILQKIPIIKNIVPQ